MTLFVGQRRSCARITDLRDLLPTGADNELTRQQRVRTRAAENALCCQRAGSPLSLAEQVSLLLALADGRLDHLADATADDAAREVDGLRAHMRAAAAPAMDRLEATQALEPRTREELEHAIAAHLRTTSGRRALFASWDR